MINGYEFIIVKFSRNVFIIKYNLNFGFIKDNTKETLRLEAPRDDKNTFQYISQNNKLLFMIKTRDKYLNFPTNKIVKFNVVARSFKCVFNLK